jgi:hypothetical protein
MPQSLAVDGGVEAGPEAPPQAPVLVVAGAAAPEPTGAPPTIHITSPAKGAVLAEAKAKDTVVKVEVKNWPLAQNGGMVHLLLDGHPVRMLLDAKETPTLADLGGGSPLSEGHHVLIAVLARASHETLKSKDALAVQEFDIGHAKAAATIDLHKPYLIVSKPDPTYEGADADHVLVDFIPVNATLADGKERVAMSLEGPGVEGSLRTTTNKLTPYYLENLRVGKYTLKVELVGADGKTFASPWATVTRAIEIHRPTPGAMPASAAPQSTDAGPPPNDAGSAANATDAGSKAPPHEPPHKTKPNLDRPPPRPPTKR